MGKASLSGGRSGGSSLPWMHFNHGKFQQLRQQISFYLKYSTVLIFLGYCEGYCELEPWASKTIWSLFEFLVACII